MEENTHLINCIVVATDFSENGNAAVYRAAHLAQEKGIALNLLHVVSPFEIYPELMVAFDAHVKDYDRIKRASGLEQLDQLAVKVRQMFGVNVITNTSIGRAHSEISKFAEDLSADLLVVGFRGETDFIDAMVGSTVAKLILTTPCAVLIVKNATSAPYHQAIAAVDLTQKSLEVCSMACAVGFNAQVEALHVFDKVKTIFGDNVGSQEAEIQKYYDEASKHVVTELDVLISSIDNKRLSSKVVDGYEPQAISARAEELNADIVVLGKKRTTVMQEFFLGSVSRAVIDMVRCDVLLT